MLEQALAQLVAALAVLGGVALAVRTVRTGIRLAVDAAEVSVAAGRAEVSARRGDLTGLAERRAEEQRARRRRRWDLLRFLAWLAWLVVPLVARWMPEGYALAAPVWLLPSLPVREAVSRRRD